MTQTDKPDAIFVGSDYMAFGVLETLKCEFGLSVPDDVSVVGYDDVEMASWKTYDLTTVRQPIDKMVTETVSLLKSLIEGDTSRPRRIEVESGLVLRSSSARSQT